MRRRHPLLALAFALIVITASACGFTFEPDPGGAIGVEDWRADAGVGIPDQSTQDALDASVADARQPPEPAPEPEPEPDPDFDSGPHDALSDAQPGHPEPCEPEDTPDGDLPDWGDGGSDDDDGGYDPCAPDAGADDAGADDGPEPEPEPEPAPVDR